MNAGEAGRLEIAVMLTPQGGGEDKARKKIKKILITRTSD